MEKLCSQEYPQQESDPAAELLSDMKISLTAIVISHLKYLASIFPPTMLAYIGTGALVLGDVNWLAALSAGGFGFVTAILLALANLTQSNRE